MKPAPVLALAFDAMEGSLVEQLIREGRMPHLAALRERGLRADVRCRPEAFVNSWMVWPTFFTGQSLGTHGWYSHKLWSSKRQHLYHAEPDRPSIQPFWEDLPDRLRLALLDVPYAFPPGRDFNGVFLSGWQGPDDFGRMGRPSGLYRSLTRRVGQPVMEPEIFGPQGAETLRHQRDEALGSLTQFADVILDVLEGDRWDLLLAAFGGAHRANHYLWSLDEADLQGAAPEEVRELERARDRLYEATDEALGRVLAAVPQDTRVLVFALHGMGPNHGWGEHFPAIMSHLRSRGNEAAPKEGLIYKLKSALPWELVRHVTRRLPRKVNHLLVPLWSRRMLDWSSTRYFALPSDGNGYVRINQRGRDAEGIVEPGAESDELLDHLTAEFLELRDLRNGSPIVEAVDRVDDIVGPDAPRRAGLPDLVVRWVDRSSRGSPGIRSSHGEIRFDTDGGIPSGRSGNHTPSAWCVGAGPGIEPGRILDPVDALDLPATILEWMGAPIPDRMEGAPLSRFTNSSPG